MVVHTAGHSADMSPIIDIAQEHNLFVIEDACQSIGAKYKGKYVGTFGDVGVFSFAHHKQVSSLGFGGIIASDNSEIVNTIRTLANHGRGKLFFQKDKEGIPRGINELPGLNLRLSEIHAAIVRVQLKKWRDDWIKRRREIAADYERLLEGTGDLKLPVEREWARHSYFRYILRTSKRNKLYLHLHTNGVACGMAYRIPLHLNETYKDGFGFSGECTQSLKSLQMTT
jgi:dTDP-4-amino-4,6-dideoxygalactose transaminase